MIVLIIFVRFLRIQRDQERATSELAAARSVQELMIPQEKLETPGFEVDSVYNPANEVGGDFFHVQPTAEGGLLVVIGDVAGKGLKAAMNVSMLMGALRRTPERSPAQDSGGAEPRADGQRELYHLPGGVVWGQRRGGAGQRRPFAALPEQPGDCAAGRTAAGRAAGGQL